MTKVDRDEGRGARVKMLMAVTLAAGVLGIALLRPSEAEKSPAPPPPSSQPATNASASEPPPALPAATLPEPSASQEFTAADLEAINQIRSRFVTGDFATALRLSDELAKRDTWSTAFHEWLREQLPAILISAGWTHLKTGDCDTAITHLMRAEAIRRSAEGAKGLAWCWQKQGQIAAADEQFAAWFSAVDQNPEHDDPGMRVLYSDLLESQGRFPEAIKVLETMSADDEVKKRLNAMRSRAEESRNQTTETTPHFTLTYRIGDHEDLATWVLQTLEESLDELIEDFGVAEPTSPIEVVLYPTESFRSAVAGGPEWAEGVFDGRLRIPVRKSWIESQNWAPLRPILRHELVHAINSGMSGGRAFPPWLEEGLAQRLSCPRDGCPAFMFGATPGNFLPPASFATSYVALAAVDAAVAYRQSLYLVLMLQVLRGGDDPIRTIYRNTRTGSAMDSDSVLAPLGLSFADLHRGATEHWNKRVVITGTGR
jgi:hypothetical protein